MALMIPDLCRFPSRRWDRVRIRFVRAGFFLLAVGWLDPGGLAGQDTQDAPAQSPGDSLTLAFEREVFVYPEYFRRNPFKSLLGGEEGPRFEALVLFGLLTSPFAGESIALIGEGTRTVIPASLGVPETITLEVTGRTYRMREGEIVGNGNVTVRTIAVDQVIVEVAEFGRVETRIMLLPRASSGGGP